MFDAGGSRTKRASLMREIGYANLHGLCFLLCRRGATPGDGNNGKKEKDAE
jgi:hypothetical protein